MRVNCSFCTLPEISEDALTKEMEDKGLTQDIGPFHKQYRCIFGFVAQMAYVYVQQFLPTSLSPLNIS